MGAQATAGARVHGAMEKKKVEENTYQTHPEYKDKFRPGPVTQIIKDVLESKLQNEKFSAENSGEKCKMVADEIKEQLKELRLNRYKIIVEVVIGEVKGQGVHKGCRSFWDPDTDSQASYICERPHLLCCVCVWHLSLLRRPQPKVQGLDGRPGHSQRNSGGVAHGRRAEAVRLAT